VPHFTSWALAASAIAGVVLALRATSNRARLLLPLASALSFTLMFNFAARRTEDRFLLPQSVLFLPYAALAFQRLWTYKRGAAWALAAAGFVPALVAVVSLDATLLTDARYTAERFLSALPRDARVEVYGSTKYLPRVAGRVVVRPGIEPASVREQAPGITELVDEAMDPRPRAPDYIVLATELSDVEMTKQPTGTVGYGLTTYRDPASRSMLRGLLDGSLGYARVLRATCSLPWPLECRHIHGSTGGEVWIYAPARASSR